MVSVIIPTYNRESTIKKSIDSVLQQTYKDLELIIVDDGSTDNTGQIINGYQDSRLHYIKAEKRGGANKARNIGIVNAKGEYIAFQDSDDIWEKDKLEKQVRVLQENKQIDGVFCRHMYYFANGKMISTPNKKFTKDLLQEKLKETLARGNVIGTPTLIVRKSCFDKIGMFDEMLPRFQDWNGVY